ncbi:response regulator transcription factor [Amycolatopsis oliviviridis]|uniref:DNA-binding response regulator n=1 Tax=Amycolatopsis oliviviridis TaxID=1471590 RepID=A0ABQ3LPI6_9PSEU|nr:response regulator transcription factor [Amycolatopsis oliviviridis]GHH19287.1 DNA-binding response regulator [Amycolatopsis oliviviridis]
MAVIRVVLADDQLLVRSGFAALLRVEAGITVVGEADDGEAAVAVVAETRPDVVLMDVRMPGIDGIEATRRIVADDRQAGVRVIMLTTFDLDEYVFDALRAGASGFLLKHTKPADLVEAVRVVAAGDALLSPSVTRRLIAEFTTRPSRPMPRAEGSAFTEREHEVVQRVAQGMSNEEIAREFVISAATVRTHVSRAMAKVNARDRAQLVVFAYRSGLVHV